MKREHCTLWLLQTLLVLLPPGLPAPCPRPCSCPHPAELHCTFRSLLSVPGAVSRHVKRVNLGFNSIGHIGVGSLSGLKRLELLMVHGNNIHSLPDGAFRDLASLQMLKMSYNKLKEINRRTFHGLWSLSRLHLDHNQLELIHPDAFQGLTSLRFLQLEGNHLQQLHATTFSTFALRDQFYISTLRHLHLSDNGLTSLPSQLLGTMPHLESLYLHGNLWTCDCGMSWFHDWEKDSPGVLKCKKDRDLPGGQLCPSCSSPRPLKDTDLHAAAPLVCSSPVISLLHGTSPPPESERQMLTSKDFKDPIGNISMGLSDEHGNKLDLECSVDELQEPSKVSWEQVSKLQLLANVSLSVELQCAVDRKKYEQLWKAIAYYSNVPAHLKRGPALTKEPELTYAYEQDSELDAGYYTGLKVQMWARPAWLMQPSVELQLNRAESSIRTVILALRTTLSELVETEQQQRLGRTWVMIDSTNRTRKVMSAILGSPSEMFCNVRSSDPAEVRWTLPDGSELASPYSGPGNRVSVSRDGRLRITAVTHSDTGTFYCMAKVPGDVAVLSFYLSVQESSSPPPGDDTSAVSMEEFAGNPISMDCPASSSPDAEINWILPSSQIVHSQDNSSKALVHFNGSLHISKTQVSDSGYYKCVAINQHGADTMVKKVSIVRRSGLIRPLRRFPVRPQSASGVSTQVKIPTENAEEASGDVDASTIRHHISGVRRRIPGNLAPGRKGIHPSRSTWQRRTMLRGSHTENQNGSAENRRRNHLSKSKIDPKKWAHILAKARERDAVSPLPASYPTKIEKALTTESLKTPDKSSDGVTVHGSKDQQYLPEQSTEPQIKEFPTHGEDDHVTTEPYSERGAANNSRHLTTAPHPTERAYTAQRTTQHTEPNLVTSSDSGFSLPQTTSVPPHGITISQPSARTASGSTVQTADPSEGRQSGAEPDDVISSINHRFSLESQTNSVKREGSGHYLGETSTLSQFEPKDATESRSEVEPSKSPSTAPKPPSRRKSESNRRPVGSKRRNGGRRKRPNRKKEKLDASNTIRPAAKASISELNTEQPRVTVGSSSAVPSTGSQAASSSRLSHKESSVLRQNHKALTETFPLPETKDGRLLLPRVSWQSSTAAPSLPALTHGNSMLGTAEVFTSALLRSADFLEDSYETSFTTEPAPLLHYDRLTGRYDSLTESQRVHQATGMETSTQPYQFTSTASSTAGGQKAASRETSRGILSTSRRLPKHRNHSSGQKEVTKTDLTPRENQQTSLNAWTDVMRSLETAVASITSTLPPHVLLPHSHRQSTFQDTTIAGRDVITLNFHPTTFPTNHKPSNTSPAIQVLTSIPPPTVVSPTPFQRTPVRPQGSTQEKRTPVRPQVTTQEEGTPVHPQGSKKEDRTLVSTQEKGTAVYPQVTSQERRTPVRPQVTLQEEGTPVHPQGSKKEDRTLVSTQEKGTAVYPQEEGTPVRPQVTLQEEGTPVRPQVTSQEERTPVHPQVSTQEEGTPVGPQMTSQEEGTPFRPQVSTQEEQTPVRPQATTQEERTLVSTHEEGTPVHPQGSTQEEGTPVSPQMTIQEERTPVRPQGSTQEERTPVRPQATPQEEGTPVHPQVSTQEEGTPVRPQGSTQEDGTPVRPQGSTQEDGTPVRPKMTIQEERTPVRPQGSTQEDGTPVRPQMTTQEEGTLIRPQMTTQEERTPVRPQGSTQEEGTPVRPQVSTKEERTPAPPQMTTQEEGTPVRPHVSTQEERTPVRPQVTTHEDRTLVSTQEKETPVHPQVTSQEEGTPVRPHVSTQEERTPVRPQMTIQEERTPVHPQVSTQEEGTPVHQRMSTQDERTLGHTSNQRGKPRITTDRSQTITVRTGADAQLPCDTEGQPMPFLSWTKASSGVSIAKNMRWQRLEVHHNGTLIIRNSQETDAGRYLCTVQNQYGTDTMTTTLLVSHQPPLRDIHVYEGGKAELECKVAGDPRVSWILPNSVQMTATSAAAPSPPQRVAVDEMGTLLISSAHLMDAGIYRCSVPGGNGMQVRLRVSAVPALIEQEKDQTVVVPEGGAAFIHCAASTATRPIIRWIAPGGMQLPAPHPPNGGNFIVFPNGTLHIKRLASKDSGRYICTAGNAAASSSRAVILRVISKPSSAKATITASSPKTTDVTYGSPLLLNCVAAGEPEPRIIWRTPSKKLVDHQFSFDSRIKVFLNGSLSIHSVTDKDRGDYLCVARNKMGDDYIQLRVNVLTKPAKIEQKMQKSSQEVIRGQDLKVDCVASGLPSPEISWALPDGTMVNPVKQRARVGGGRSRRYVVFDNGTLYFNEVGLPEEGDYICYAQNQLGKDEMKVRVRVKGGTTRPQIQDKGPKTVQVLHGKTVTLQCKAIGDPVPVVTWMSPKNRLISPDSNKYQVLQDGSLVVQKVQGPDGGNYTCLARSSVGQDDKVTRVEVLPTPPVINGLRGDSDTMEVTAVQGERTLVDCATKGAPSPQVMWILPGNVILPAPYYSNHRTVHPNGTLEIRSTQRTDSGQMVCVARNEGGEVRMLVHLEVKETVRGAKIEAPEKESFALRVGNSVTLNCTIDGLELTHLTWILPDGTPLHTGARISKFFHRLDGSLVISNPSVAEAGVYRCMGHNPAGLFESTITLSPGRKPQILNRYISPVSVLDGETLFLHCQTTGEPLRLTWTLPSGVVLNRLQNAGRYSILQNGTIAIRQASIYDRGAYVCRAANEYGSSLLSVLVKIVANQPRITRGPPSVTYAKHGVAVQLNCATAGTPAAEVSWETPDKVRMVVSAQPRLFGNKYLHPQGSLIIQNPTQRDSGVYRCTARNAAGVDSKTTFLNVF
ncbi:PREDICTED: matrix-remodeling-associated protein 5-like [Cyprinodon variegatus]|uniref:matrix-remodeling-associated protein 5-like n=1 Tax=Cyprinodon variegatus TaxID=28743 RepID=UPI00074271F2|nr:PREDICTED: matrix-remodeling-associated protein 5-like [Cyprinodon variegatus]